MQSGESEALSSPQEATLDYLFDMIAQMAEMARRAGQLRVAIHLEALLAAEGRSAGRGY